MSGLNLIGKRLAASLALVATLGGVLTGSFSSPAYAKKASVGGLYNVSLAGFTIGKASLALVLQGNAYSAKVGLEPAGIGTLFSTGKGSATASGWLVGNKVVPSKYEMASHAADIDFYVALTQGSGHIRSFDVAPQFRPNKERIQVTSRHRHNAMDPLSAALMPVRIGKNGLTAEACKRTLPIFDGWTRFDIKMSYKGMEKVSGHGYDGPVVVCSASWKPVAGHRPSKDSVKYMAKADMETWLAPAGRQDVLIPYRISIQTQTGRLVLEANKLNIEGDGSDRAGR